MVVKYRFHWTAVLLFYGMQISSYQKLHIFNDLLSHKISQYCIKRARGFLSYEVFLRSWFLFPCRILDITDVDSDFRCVYTKFYRIFFLHSVILTRGHTVTHCVFPL